MMIPLSATAKQFFFAALLPFQLIFFIIVVVSRRIFRWLIH
jgi:hypothetical protein